MLWRSLSILWSLVPLVRQKHLVQGYKLSTFRIVCVCSTMSGLYRLIVFSPFYCWALFEWFNFNSTKSALMMGMTKDQTAALLLLMLAVATSWKFHGQKNRSFCWDNDLYIYSILKIIIIMKILNIYLHGLFKIIIITTTKKFIEYHYFARTMITLIFDVELVPKQKKKI